MSVYRDNTLKQVSDGKRSWRLNDIPSSDPELFAISIVGPLRELRNEGVIADLSEHIGSQRGRRIVDRIDMILKAR